VITAGCTTHDRGESEEAEFERVLATVMFNDIVGSTRKMVGDRAWRALVERHHASVRTIRRRYRGVEVDTAGDGFLATFDGPARAVRRALTIMESVRALDLEIRAGIHTGEVETIDGKVGGIAVAMVHVSPRVLRSSEVLVSQTGQGSRGWERAPVRRCRRARVERRLQTRGRLYRPARG
jgi:class 3 adenylate cyclase